MSNHELLADANGPYCMLSARESFEALNQRERLYAHHMMRAGFLGARILLQQGSPESPKIFELILSLYKLVDGDWGSLREAAMVSEAEMTAFLEYSAMFLANIGNYRSNGNKKFIPRLSPTAFSAICSISGETRELFSSLEEVIFSLSPSMLGYPDENHQSSYYPDSPNITKSEIQRVQDVLNLHKIHPENTRLKQVKSSNGESHFELLVASSQRKGPKELQSHGDGCGPKVLITHGDYADILSGMIGEIRLAKNYASNEVQSCMLEELILSLETGDMESFRKHQELWVTDRDPQIEISHGFIEIYQDPHGIRSQWQGFVSIRSKSLTEIYQQLVNRAPDFIEVLPWNTFAADGEKSPYENPVFNKPGFTNVDVLAFCSPEVWSGINLPNYEDICQRTGFKNITLGNVESNPILDVIVPFVQEKELPLYRACRAKSVEVMLACHELLGHGSGRLFIEASAGEFNFDSEKLPRHLLDEAPIRTWYQPGETWQGVFGDIACSFEECRADGISLFLVSHKPLLEVFGYSDSSPLLADDITYIGWLHMIQGAIKGLSQWDSRTRKWGQAHKQGQFAILRCLLDVGPGLLSIRLMDDDLSIHLDRDKIWSHGLPALAKFLLTLQVFKSTADVKRGREFYEKYSEVTEEFKEYRAIVLKRRPNRTQWIQPNTIIDNGKVNLREYPATMEGLIQSWAERDI